jgi:hypothetical protein
MGPMISTLKMYQIWYLWILPLNIMKDTAYELFHFVFI